MVTQLLLGIVKVPMSTYFKERTEELSAELRGMADPLEESTGRHSKLASYLGSLKLESTGIESCIPSLTSHTHP